MDNESLLKNSAGPIFCGILSLILIFSFIILPKETINGKIDPVIKGFRPYRRGAIINTSNKRFFQGYKQKIRESIFQSIILEAAERYDMEPALIKAVIMAESGYDPMAISKKGAVGLMQLMPETADDLGVEDLFDPAHNINGGVRYLKILLDRFDGSLELALAAYNAGSQNVRDFNGIPPFKSTQYYVEKVFKYYHDYQSSEI